MLRYIVDCLRATASSRRALRTSLIDRGGVTGLMNWWDSKRCVTCIGATFSCDASDDNTRGRGGVVARLGGATG